MALDDGFVTESNETELDLGVDLDTVPAQHAVPAGEYQLCLVSAEIKQQKPEKGDGRFIQVSMEVVGDPNSKLVRHVMMLPNTSDDDRKKNARLRNIGDFYKAFSIPSVGKVNLAMYMGNFGYAILNVEDDGGEFGEQNRVKKFIAGR